MKISFLLLFTPSLALTRKIAVIGSTGKLGRLAVCALVRRGFETRCLVRHVPAGIPSGAADATPEQVVAWLASMPGVELVQGDVTDAAAVSELVRGCEACVAAHGARRTRAISDLWRDPTEDPTHSKAVNYVGVRNIIDACRVHSVQRIVRVTGKGETPWSFFSILINGLGSMAKAWNYEGENLLRASGLDYTIVRPGIMRADGDDTPRDSLALADDGTDLAVSAIAYASIAELCVQCLDAPNAANATLCAMTVAQGEGAEDWGSLLETVQPDRREFRTDLFQQHRLAVRTGGVLAAIFAASAATALVAIARALLSLLLAQLATPR